MFFAAILHIFTVEQLYSSRLQVFGKCCKDFEPNAEMLSKFNAQMYLSLREETDQPANPEAEEDDPDQLDAEDYEQIITLFNDDGIGCVINL